jgi:hypothetical protein
MIVTVNKVYFLEHLSRIIQYSFTSLIYFKEMKYLRRTAGYILIDYKRNETFLEEFHVTSLEQKIYCTYRRNWFQHVHEMEDYRLPKYF